jgi:fructose-1,6-bisphosphatase/sedoheptulose 1,7-bisphosphatase-like protein
MDTNALIAQLLQQRPQVPQGESIAIVVLIITSLGSVLAAIASYFKALATHATAQDAVVVAKVTSDNVQKIEISVNSERTAMLAVVADLRSQIQKLTTDAAVSQNQRIADLKQAIVTSPKI